MTRKKESNKIKEGIAYLHNHRANRLKHHRDDITAYYKIDSHNGINVLVVSYAVKHPKDSPNWRLSKALCGDRMKNMADHYCGIEVFNFPVEDKDRVLSLAYNILARLIIKNPETKKRHL